jgi:hypothetical protein
LSTAGHEPGGRGDDGQSQRLGGDPSESCGVGGPAGEVVGDRDEREPGGVGGEPPGRQVRQAGVVLEIRDGVLHDRVATVISFDGQQRAGAVGDDRVIGEHHIEREL